MVKTLPSSNFSTSVPLFVIPTRFHFGLTFIFHLLFMPSLQSLSLLAFVLTSIFLPIVSAQTSWSKVTADLPLPDIYREADGRVRFSRLFQFEDQVVALVTARNNPAGSVLVSSTDGTTWKMFPEALEANRLTATNGFSDIIRNVSLGPASRLEVTYRNSEGTFKATGFPDQEFPIPSPRDVKISEESALEIEILKREVIHVPALPARDLFNLGSIGDQPLTLLNGVASGSPLRLWCPECPTNSGNTAGFWESISVVQNRPLLESPHTLAGGPTSAYLIDIDTNFLSLTLIEENVAVTRQSVTSEYRGSFNAIASSEEAFVAVGSATPNGSPLTGGIITRKPFGEAWEVTFIPGVREFLHIYHFNPGWVATAEGGSIWTSTDGSEWAQTGTAPFDLAKLVEIEGRWLGATTNGEIYSSPDLMSWTRQLERTALTQGLVATESHFFAMVGNTLRVSPLATSGSPDITSQPPSPAILSGESATLAIVATGENLTYQWYQGLAGDRSSPIAGADQNPFVTTPITEEASYWVEVANSLGSDESFTARVILQSQPEITNQAPSRENDLSEFRANTTSVTATGNGLDYQWYQGLPGDLSNPLLNETDRIFSKAAVLPGTITYYVRVSNRVGHRDSDPFQFTVHPVLPEIRSEQDDVEAEVADFVSLRVSTRGPLRTYQWYQGISGDLSAPIEAATNSSFQSATDQVGEFSYWLQIINPAGSINSRTISVKVFARDYQEWASQYGLAPEVSDRQASAAGDEFTNLFRYLARLSPHAPASSVYQNQHLYRAPDTGNNHLALWVRTRPLPADYSLIVEESQTLEFDGTEAVPTGDEISHGDGSTSRRYRTSLPLTSSSSQFLRVRLTPSPE